MDKDKIIISLMNQKSVGKSTIGMALCGHFTWTMGLRCLFLDTDDTQRSVWRKHKREYKGGRELDIDTVSIRNEVFFNDYINEHWEDYDVFIVDTPGSLMDSSAKFRIAEMSDLILVPINPGDMDIDSMMLFINTIDKSLGENTTVKIVRSKYDPRDKDWIEHDEEYEGEYMGHEYMKSNILDRRKYRRYKYTTIPITDDVWNPFFNEIENILENKNLIQWQNEKK